jgi:predicted metal-dependent hydrolase
MYASIPISLSNGKVLEIKIKNSKRVKHLWLKADVYGVYVVVPSNYSIEKIHDFIESKKKWILKTSEYYKKLREGYGEGNLALNTISFLGAIYRLQIVKDTWPSTIISDNLKLITFHVTDRRKYKYDIKEWYRRQTAQIVAERLPIISRKLDLQYNKVSIKSNTSRWGSCSKKRNLNFNLLLAAVPIKVIDYVLTHELIHLIELNHSKRFWSLVACAYPEYKKYREWLNRYGPLIKIARYYY